MFPDLMQGEQIQTFPGGMIPDPLAKAYSAMHTVQARPTLCQLPL